MTTDLWTNLLQKELAACFKIEDVSRLVQSYLTVAFHPVARFEQCAYPTEFYDWNKTEQRTYKPAIICTQPSQNTCTILSIVKVDRDVRVHTFTHDGKAWNYGGTPSIPKTQEYSDILLLPTGTQHVVYHTESAPQYQDLFMFTYGKDSRPMYHSGYQNWPLWFSDQDMLYGMAMDTISRKQCPDRIHTIQASGQPEKDDPNDTVLECSFFSRRLLPNGTSNHEPSCNWNGSSLFFESTLSPAKFVIDDSRSQLWIMFSGSIPKTPVKCTEVCQVGCDAGHLLIQMAWSARRGMRIINRWPYRVSDFALDSYHGILATIHVHDGCIYTHWLKDGSPVLRRLEATAMPYRSLGFVSVDTDPRVQLMTEDSSGVIQILTPLAA